MNLAAPEVDRDSWDAHWDQYAQSAQANPAQQYRRRLVLSWLDLPKLGSARVLDIGSGQGDFAAELKRFYPQVEILGLELSRSGVEISREKVPGATFLEVNLLESSSPPAQFEGWATRAVCSEVLEHVDDPRQLLMSARTYLAPGCKLIVTVPGGPMSAFDHHIGHRKHYAPAQLGILLESAGFQVDQAAGAGFPFFNLYRLVVIARGQRLVRDVSSHDRAKMPFLARFSMGVFRSLFRFNLSKGRWGWQTIARAYVPQNRPQSNGPTPTK
jgi:SAM-dependent methyltransferase